MQRPREHLPTMCSPRQRCDGARMILARKWACKRPATSLQAQGGVVFSDIGHAKKTQIFCESAALPLRGIVEPFAGRRNQREPERFWKCATYGVRKSSSMWTQLDKSVRTALGNTICRPLSLSRGKQKDRRSPRGKWDKRESQWLRWAKVL